MCPEIITKRLGFGVLRFFSYTTQPTTSFLRLGSSIFPTPFVKKKLSTFKISYCSDFMVGFSLPLGFVFLVCWFVGFFFPPDGEFIQSSVLNQKRNEIWPHPFFWKDSNNFKKIMGNFWNIAVVIFLGRLYHIVICLLYCRNEFFPW